VLKLLERATRYDARLKALKKDVKPLEGYYVEARYPNTISEEYIPAEFFERREAELALIAAGKTLKLVKRTLKRGAEESKPKK
jgi:HEPN domain-containing protein